MTMPKEAIENLHSRQRRFEVSQHNRNTFLNKRKPVEQRIAAAYDIASDDSPEAPLDSGEALLELAASHEPTNGIITDPQRLDLLGDARLHLETVAGSGGDFRPSFIAYKARCKLAAMPCFQWLAVCHSVPRIEFQQDYYVGLLEIAQKLIELDELTDFSDKERSDQIGSLAEHGIYLLTARWALKEGAEQAIYLPSFFSDDRGDRGAVIKKDWDITGFTQYDQAQAPNSTYKIQVKANGTGDEYSDDITVINAGNDLKIYRHAKPDLLTLIPLACLEEAGAIGQVIGGMTPSELLDRKTGLLLDKLG